MGHFYECTRAQDGRSRIDRRLTIGKETKYSTPILFFLTCVRNAWAYRVEQKKLNETCRFHSSHRVCYTNAENQSSICTVF